MQNKTCEYSIRLLFKNKHDRINAVVKKINCTMKNESLLRNGLAGSETGAKFGRIGHKNACQLGHNTLLSSLLTSFSGDSHITFNCNKYMPGFPTLHKWQTAFKIKIILKFDWDRIETRESFLWLHFYGKQYQKLKQAAQFVPGSRAWFHLDNACRTSPRGLPLCIVVRETQRGI